MLKEGPIGLPSPVMMGMGMVQGFIKSNIGRVPEERLRSQIETAIKMMQSWLDGPEEEKHASD